jgi:protein-tyrosine phosphatase
MHQTPAAVPSRHLPLAMSYNIRDVGGYATADGGRVRWRRLLRADGLHRLTPEAQEELIRQGIATIVDLRWPAELITAPNVFAGSTRVRYQHLPVWDDTVPPTALPRSNIETYRQMLDSRAPAFRAIVAALAAPGGLPAVVHCAAGKDRTGVVVALALAVVGVPDETIVEDYVLSNHYLANGGYYDEVRQRVLARGESWAEVEPLLHCAPEHMAQTLAYLEGRYGGAERYLLSIGVTPAELATLRAALVEPAADEATA